MGKSKLIVVSLTAILLATGCVHIETSEWSADHVTTLSGFNVPECALYSADDGIVYVSNIESAPDEYWTDDGKGHISVLGPDNSIVKKRWVDSKPGSVLHAPKGMCVLGGYLYFTNNTRLMRCSVEGGKVEMVASGFNRANDLATDGKSVWLSDVADSKIYCVSAKGDKREILSPPGINGLTFSDRKMFGVSWTEHEVYELDPAGKKGPVAFGLAEHFTNLDGIEVLRDGTFIVSDFNGNKVCAVSSDRSCVITLVEIPTPADISVNRKDGLLYIPQLKSDTLAIYRIKKTP
jgi:sugar lactone lactonase YvrE